jgi:hypothetical protein
MRSVWHTCNNVPFAFSPFLPVAPLSPVWLCAAASPSVRQEHASIALCYYIYGFSSYPMLLLSACCAAFLRGNCEVASCRCHTFHPDTPAVTNTWRVAADLHNGLALALGATAAVMLRRHVNTPPSELLKILVLYGQWLLILANLVGIPWPATLSWPLQVSDVWMRKSLHSTIWRDMRWIYMCTYVVGNARAPYQDCLLALDCFMSSDVFTAFWSHDCVEQSFHRRLFARDALSAVSNFDDCLRDCSQPCSGQQPCRFADSETRRVYLRRRICHLAESAALNSKTGRPRSSILCTPRACEVVLMSAQSAASAFHVHVCCR